MISDDAGVVRAVVLIDDDQDFLHVMQRRLKAQRVEYAPTGPVDILAFTDPVEALVSFPAEGICVVIIDYNMPDGTGLEWLPKALKAGAGPVILLTNQNDANIAAEAFRAGASDYIVKADVMTDEKRLGRAIREAVHRFRLESRNHVLTRQLKIVNLELESKNKRLKELSDTAHRFVDDVAHDFRTPLTVIQQYASLVSEGLSGPVTNEQREHLSTITEATRELAEMVDDFLDSSKLRSRALSVDRRRHTVGELFEAIAPILKVRTEAKQISIQCTVAEGLPSFFGDLPKAGRVMTNLVVNAIKVTPQGRSLKLWASPNEAGNVTIGVTDEGPGLRSEDLQIIFERFKQIQEPQLAGTKGFGLGLSIVKQLTWLNLGSISVQSERGKGSTFSFTLPSCEPDNILSSYLESIQLLEEAGDLWMLQIQPANENSDTEMIRRMISTFSYPMDLILQGYVNHTLFAIGVSRDAGAWTRRLQNEVRRLQDSIREKEAGTLNIKTLHSWPRDMDRTRLHAAILESLNKGAPVV